VSESETALAGSPSGTVGGENRYLGAERHLAARMGLLTGPIGVGKTTVAERVVGLARRHGLTYGGLVAPAMTSSCGQKVGIWGVDLRTGERRILARTDRELGGPAVGPYFFDAAALAWSVGVVQEAIGACDLLVVDEIGKLELWQGAGLAPILHRLAAGEARRALLLVRDFLLAELQSSLGAVEQLVFEVSQENRAGLPAYIVERFYA
jgi:nucleoside-triphosphatase THEP1